MSLRITFTLKNESTGQTLLALSEPLKIDTPGAERRVKIFFNNCIKLLRLSKHFTGDAQ